MRSPRDFTKPLAMGAPQPVLEIPVKPSRCIHFFDPSNPKMAAKLPELARQTDILLGNLEDAIPADRKGDAREGLVKVGREVDLAPDLHQALAGVALPVGRDRVLEVAEEDVGLARKLGELGRHLRVRGVEEVDAARGLDGDLEDGLWRAHGERLREVAWAAHGPGLTCAAGRGQPCRKVSRRSGSTTAPARPDATPDRGRMPLPADPRRPNGRRVRVASSLLVTRA